MARTLFQWLAVCLALLSSATSVLAQTPVARAVPVLVSPGAERRATPAVACPVFNWAPTEQAVGYELAVHEWLPELSAEPVMRATLPGRSAGWTPAAGNCLRVGGTYFWFLRELNTAGEPIGAWSAGLAFRVTTPADAEVAATDTTSRESAALGAPPPPAETPPQNPGGNAPLSVQDQLAAISAKLDQLLSPSSLEICVEAGLQGEVGGQFGGSIEGKFLGSVGAEAFANGVKGTIEAAPSWGLNAAVKGALSLPKLAFCYDLFSNAAAASATPGRAAKIAAVTGANTLDANALPDRLLALAASLDLNTNRLAQAMDAVPSLGEGVDPWSALRSDGPVTRLAQLLPIPGPLGEALKDPGQIIASLRSQLALCSNTNLPPAVAGIVDEFCGLARNERFSRLLNNVESGVNSVRGTVDGIRQRIEDIIGALPTSSDCKFFCN